jgi:xylan 1,4-beta-xylosidase
MKIRVFLYVSFAMGAMCAANQHAACQAAPPAPVEIRVDLSKSEGPYKPIYNWFGYDEVNYTTAPNGRLLLHELHDLSPVPVYIRAHHMFTSGDGVPELKWSSTNIFTVDAAGKPIYDFHIIDQIFDAYKQAGVRPMVELGFMPKDLAADVAGVTAYQVHYPGSTVAGASNNPPKDYAMWGELVRRFVAHLVQRYGKGETSMWYWEVWNEPDISYWHGTAEDYYKLYDYSVAAIRKELPEAKVGGPASTGPASEKAVAFLDAFLKHCENDKSAADGKAIPLDFISFHPKGSPKVVDGTVQMGLNAELRAAENGFRIVAAHQRFKDLPIILSEADPEGCAACSMKVNPANAYRNGTLYPTYTAPAMKALYELSKKYKVNLLAMVSWSFEFEGKDWFEGFRSLATNGVDKPVLNVFRMAGLMRGERVQATSTGAIALDEMIKSGVRSTPDVDVIATKAEHEAAVMLWNYHDDDKPAPGAAVEISVDGIPAGVTRVLVEHYRIDDNHSNAYTVWKSLGSPQNPAAVSPEQEARLKAAGQLEMLSSPQWVDVTGGEVRISTELPRQALSLLRIHW